LSLRDLTQAEIAWLLRFYDIFDRQLRLNMSKERIMRKFPSNLRGDAKEMLDRLRVKGYFYPHGGRNTYFISRQAADVEEAYKKQLSNTSA
jgi:hypothetical protein